MSETSRFNIPYPSENEDPWFDKFQAMINEVDAQLFALHDERNTFLVGGGIVQWTGSILSWASAIEAVSPTTGIKATINPSSQAIADGQFLYVSLARGAVSPSNATMVAGQALSIDGHLKAIAYRSGTYLYWFNGRLQKPGETLADGVGLREGGGGGGGTTVKVSALDTTADYLALKMAATEGVALSTIGVGSLQLQAKLDVNGLVADGAPDGAADYVATWDASAGAHKKVLLQDIPATAGPHDHPLGIHVTGPLGRVWLDDDQELKLGSAAPFVTLKPVNSGPPFGMVPILDAMSTPSMISLVSSGSLMVLGDPTVFDPFPLGSAPFGAGTAFTGLCTPGTALYQRAIELNIDGSHPTATPLAAGGELHAIEAYMTGNGADGAGSKVRGVMVEYDAGAGPSVAEYIGFRARVRDVPVLGVGFQIDFLGVNPATGVALRAVNGPVGGLAVDAWHMNLGQEPEELRHAYLEGFLYMSDRGKATPAPPSGDAFKLYARNVFAGFADAVVRCKSGIGSEIRLTHHGVLNAATVDRQLFPSALAAVLRDDTYIDEVDVYSPEYVPGTFGGKGHDLRRVVSRQANARITLVWLVQVPGNQQNSNSSLNKWLGLAIDKPQAMASVTLRVKSDTTSAPALTLTKALSVGPSYTDEQVAWNEIPGSFFAGGDQTLAVELELWFLNAGDEASFSGLDFHWFQTTTNW